MTPQNFLFLFRNAMHEAGIRFALTSGQACVYFGIQQTTKDSDWIVEPDDLGKLDALLQSMDCTDNQSVSFRSICGAPLRREFLQNGWTSHLVVTDSNLAQHHLDFFGVPPRVKELERDDIQPDYASRLTVAKMKKTDREKDWPFVAALGRQAVAGGDLRGVLYGQDDQWLIRTWAGIDTAQRAEFVRTRPLLGLIESNPNRLRRALMIEKQIWQTINRRRYNAYQVAWKQFFRRWRRETNFKWPLDRPFADQSRYLSEAAIKHELLQAPMDNTRRNGALVDALNDAAEIFAASYQELQQIAPPLEVMLP